MQEDLQFSKQLKTFEVSAKNSLTIVVVWQIEVAKEENTYRIEG